MPTIARLYIKTSLCYLGAALLTAFAMAVGTIADAPDTAALWQPYLHLFVVGWLTQLIFGVAYWLIPRYSRENPFGRSQIVIAAYVLLNLGVVLRLVAELGWPRVRTFRG